MDSLVVMVVLAVVFFTTGQKIHDTAKDGIESAPDSTTGTAWLLGGGCAIVLLFLFVVIVGSSMVLWGG